MAKLRWPRRGHFRDARRDVSVGPNETIDTDEQDLDDDDVEHYLDRGFELVEADDDQDSDDDADADDQAEDAEQDAAEGDDPDANPGEDVDEPEDDGGNDEDFDVDGFLDRTPVGEVADDIDAGDADGFLDEVEEQADRTTVIDAVQARRNELGD